MKTDPTPFFQHLKPGDYLSPTELEHWLGEQLGDVDIPLPQTDPRFDPLVVRLAKTIEAERPDLVTRIRRHGIEVLAERDKPAQSEHERKRGLRKLMRAVMINQRTVPALLSPTEKARHDHATHVNATVCVAALEAGRRMSTQRLLNLAQRACLPPKKGTP